MKIFLDTSAIVAYYNLDDKYHAEAEAVMESIKKGVIPLTRFYVTDYIIDEAMTFIQCVLNDHGLAVEVGRALLQSPFTLKMRVDEELFQDAWARFEASEEASFTDCASFAAMERHGVTHAFTFDGHFREAGFRTLPESRS